MTPLQKILQDALAKRSGDWSYAVKELAKHGYKRDTAQCGMPVPPLSLSTDIILCEQLSTGGAS
jgi:hypothetical protein